MKYSEIVAVYEKLDGTTKRLEKTAYLSDFLKKVPADSLAEVVLLLQGRVFPAWDERRDRDSQPTYGQGNINCFWNSR